jgi:polysaccharide export outer membrane protein
MKIDVLKFTTLLVLAVALLGCASGRPSYDATEIPVSVATQSDDYKIGPGDSLQIFVWDHGDLSTSVAVRPDGKISTPLVEDLQAAGRTPTELARDIEIILTEYIRTPVVTVIMQGFIGEGEQQVRVVGQAMSPRAFQYRQGMTVLDVMIAVGGLTEFAAGNKAKVVRKTPSGDIEIRVRLSDLLNDGDVSQNIDIMPGDVVIIPQSFF